MLMRRWYKRTRAKKCQKSEQGPLGESVYSSLQSGHHYPHVIVQGQARPILGDVHYHNTTEQRHVDTGHIRSFGLCMGQAPQIDPDAFKGRTKELEQLQNWLLPAKHPQRQCIVSIVGLGGMGKTQLSLAHVRECANEYSSIFWIDARDETTLRQGLAAISTIVFPESASQAVRDADTEKHAIARVRQWLSEPENSQWLLIFDNYDDPQLPHIRSATGYDIRPFFPTRSHGSILITTRSTRLAFSRQLQLGSLEDVSTSVSILSQRSGRNLSDDPQASDLARRLGGLPLALATAGTFLAAASMACDDYRILYESMWTELFGTGSEELFEYPQRTLSSTWTISLNHVRAQDGDAAELLQFLAFLSPRDIWYELIKAGARSKLPWMARVTQTQVHFTRAMSKLRDYSLVELVAGSYQLHPCLHDWLVQSLAIPPPKSLFVTAVICIADSVYDRSSPQYWAQCRRLSDHMEQLESSHLLEGWGAYSSDKKVFYAAHTIALAKTDIGLYSQAEQMYKRALTGKERALGQDHTSTLDTINNLGVLYVDQGKLKEAEQMYMRALPGRERALGWDHTLTLDTINNLGYLYLSQSKPEAAEQMFVRALAGYKQALGQHHTLTLSTIKDLGFLYKLLGRLNEAEQMYMQALIGYEKTFGFDNSLTLNISRNLGILYHDQGRLAEAAQTVMRTLRGYEKIVWAEKPQHAIYDFAYLMNHSMRLPTLDTSETSSKLVRLIRFVRDNGKGNTLAVGTLGRALLFHNDEKNAQWAFLHCTRYINEQLMDFGGVICGGCLHMLTSKTGRHICKPCADMDLCDVCMAEYKKDALNLVGCSGHVFFTVDMRGLETRPSLDTWLEHLSAEYGVDALTE